MDLLLRCPGLDFNISEYLVVPKLLHLKTARLCTLLFSLWLWSSIVDKVRWLFSSSVRRCMNLWSRKVKLDEEWYRFGGDQNRRKKRSVYHRGESVGYVVNIQRTAVMFKVQELIHVINHEFSTKVSHSWKRLLVCCSSCFVLSVCIFRRRRRKRDGSCDNLQAKRRRCGTVDSNQKDHDFE